MDTSYNNRNSFERVQMPQINIKNVSADLFSDQAQKAASACSNAINGRNKSTQIRRFYDELVLWHDKVFSGKTEEEQEQKFKELEPYIQMLRAKAAYSKGRNLIDEAFFGMFDSLIRQIKDKEQLKTAKLFMEAFLGYKKCFESNNGNN